MSERSFGYFTNVTNQAFRDEWVTKTIEEAARALPNRQRVLLDVGAGSSPYKGAAENIGFEYQSHDFNSYVPSSVEAGLQNTSWEYADHTYVCDILELPSKPCADVVLCTEVLEHVPDPVRAFQKMSQLLRPGGYLIVTVPFMSLMHQAPFWFSSGLSPFWFEYWSSQLNIEIVELNVHGDYADLLSQELLRFHLGAAERSTFPLYRRGRAFISRKLNNHFRKKSSRSLLESGGFGTLFVGKQK